MNNNILLALAAFLVVSTGMPALSADDSGRSPTLSGPPATFDERFESVQTVDVQAAVTEYAESNVFAVSLDAPSPFSFEIVEDPNREMIAGNVRFFTRGLPQDVGGPTREMIWCSMSKILPNETALEELHWLSAGKPCGELQKLYRRIWDLNPFDPNAAAELKRLNAEFERKSADKFAVDPVKLVVIRNEPSLAGEDIPEAMDCSTLWRYTRVVQQRVLGDNASRKLCRDAQRSGAIRIPIQW